MYRQRYEQRYWILVSSLTLTAKAPRFFAFAFDFSLGIGRMGSDTVWMPEVGEYISGKAKQRKRSAARDCGISFLGSANFSTSKYICMLGGRSSHSE
jgi:hypothetical protein